MAKSKDLRKTLIYVTLILSTILSLLEFVIGKIKNDIYKSNSDNIENRYLGRTIYDPITGWRQKCDPGLEGKDYPKDLICNKHGLIKTPYQTKEKSEQTIGILLLGNSVAMGEGLYSKNNKKTFASQLEIFLRESNQSIDLINGAYAGFNSWQEHLETVRYMNSEPLHDDLPKLNMIVSFGGIQDFWNHLRLLSNSKETSHTEYSYASGLMINIKNITYIKKVVSSYSGDISNGINALLASIASRSNTYYLLKLLQEKFVGKNQVADKSQIKINIVERRQYFSLPLITKNRFGINYKEYATIRDRFIKSITRNIKANAILMNKGKYIYAYAPTYFSTIKINQIKAIPVKGISHLIDKNKYALEIYENEMHLLEKDYRQALLKSISSNKWIKVLDLSDSAKDPTWFTDYSHFNEYAASQLASQLAKELIPLIGNN